VNAASNAETRSGGTPGDNTQILPNWLGAAMRSGVIAAGLVSSRPQVLSEYFAVRQIANGFFADLRENKPLTVFYYHGL